MPDEDQAEAQETAAWALEKATGVRASTIEAETTGLTNQVFRADSGKKSYIVRLGSAPEKLDVFEREREVIARVGAIGVPVVETIAVGLARKRPFMISHRVSGEAALHHPRRHDILVELGKLARRVHSVRTTGYGATFGWPDQSHPDELSWQEWLRRDLAARERLDVLGRNTMISDRQFAALNATLDEIERWDDLPVLHHGDLRLKNVLVDADGVIQAVIDWEDSVSSVGSHWDVSIALHDLSIDGKEAFLLGYGLPDKVVRETVPIWRLFNTLNYVPTVLKMVEADDRAGLERLRTRLGGSLELYAAS